MHSPDRDLQATCPGLNGGLSASKNQSRRSKRDMWQAHSSPQYIERAGQLEQFAYCPPLYE